MEERTVEVNGARFAYVERGSGEPVILVHGSVNDWRTWRPQLDALSSRFRVIAYSRRYAWPNEPIPDGVDDQIMPHVDDLLALLRALDVAPAHLVGNSWGAFVCLLAAMREPDAVRSLTLEEPPLLPLFISTPPRVRELLHVLVTRPRTGIALLKFMATVLGPSISALKRGKLDDSVRIFAQGVIGKDAYAALPDEFREQFRANAKTHAAQFLGKGMPPLRAQDIARIRQPVLLLTGERSPALFRRLIDRLAELLPHSSRVVIPNASHVMHAQNPAAVNDAVLRLLRRDESAPANPEH